MRMGSRVLFVVLLLLPFVAMAASGGEHHGAEGVPWKMIGVQIFNFVFLFGLLIYLLRKTVIEHFIERRRVYQELVSKAESAKQEAEGNLREITGRLDALKAAGRDNATKAKSEALELKQRLLQEANELSAKLKEDAKKTAEIELQKAKDEIRNFAFSESLRLAEEKLSKQPDAVDQNKLQNEFIDKIQAVTQ